MASLRGLSGSKITIGGPHTAPTGHAHGAAKVLALAAFREHVTRLWWRALKRRGQRDKRRLERYVMIANEWRGVRN